MPEFTQKPALWFDPRSLEKSADGGAWTRGLMLYRNQKVLSLDIDPAGDHWLLMGEVQGTQREPYEVSVEMALKADGQIAYWDSTCECAVGTDCKHGVALMLKAAFQGLQMLGAGAAGVLPTSMAPPSPEAIENQRQAALARAAEVARLEAQAQLLR